MKWNMGWMNDTLAYMEKDPIYRSYHHDHLTFGMVYAYTEHFIQALSPRRGGPRKTFSSGKNARRGRSGPLRGSSGLLWLLHRSSREKTSFHGSGICPGAEWSENRELDWFLLSEPKHLGMQRYMHSLYEIYREYPALYELDYEPGGFQWMDPDDAEESIVSFARFGRNGNNLLFVINFTPVERKEYRLGTPCGGSYELLLDSSWKKFGGTREELHKIYEAENIPSGQRETSFSYDLSGYEAAIFSF